MEKNNLQQIGFSEGESEIYIALLNHGKSSVMNLAKLTGRHRTHIYDTIEKLKQKGLVSESIIDNKRFLVASSPDNLLFILKEREEMANKIVNELKKSIVDGEINVETYKGTAGLKVVLRDILREKKDYVGYGEGWRFAKILPEFYEQFRSKSEALKIKLRLILKKGTKISKRKGLQIKYLDYISPSTTFIYADKILIIIWEPFPTAIRITDSQTFKSYKNYFNLLWKIAEE